MPRKKSSVTRSNRSPRRLSVRAVLRKSPDLETIASTVEALALAQAEKEAQAAAEGLKERRP